MDPAYFKKELQKYKVVRLEDYCLPRYKKSEVKQSSSAKPTSHRDTRYDDEKSRVKIDTNTATFWTQFEASLNEILTPNESKNFLTHFKKNHNEVAEQLSLEDLNIAASKII